MELDGGCCERVGKVGTYGFDPRLRFILMDGRTAMFHGNAGRPFPLSYPLCHGQQS